MVASPAFLVPVSMYISVLIGHYAGTWLWRRMERKKDRDK